MYTVHRGVDLSGGSGGKLLAKRTWLIRWYSMIAELIPQGFAMQLKRIAILYCWISCAASAQTSQPAPPAGPTMQQTIDFISNLYAKQGPVQTTGLGKRTDWSMSLQLEGDCSLIVKTRNKSVPTAEAPGHTGYAYDANTTVLDLARSEPKSISINANDTYTPVLYFVLIEHAYREIRSQVDTADDSAAVPLPPGSEVGGRVKSSTGTTIVFVSDAGRLMSYSPDKKVKLEAMEPMTGKVSPVTVSEFSLGDIILVHPKEVILVKLTPPLLTGYSSFGLLSVTDKDVATRLAKALIHAMVLCHNDDKPSIF